MFAFGDKAMFEFMQKTTIYFAQKENAPLNTYFNSMLIDNMEPIFPERFEAVKALYLEDMAANKKRTLKELELQVINQKRVQMGLQSLNISPNSVATLSNAFRIKLKTTAPLNERSFVTAIQRYSQIEFAEENGLVTSSFAPNDPSYVNQWGLKNTAQVHNGTPGTAGADLNMEQAWDITKGDSNVIIAILDSGVDPHVEFGSRMLAGKNFVAGANANAQIDVSSLSSGHGTPVASIAAASGDNSEGVAGICWNCKILPVRVADSTGFGSFGSIAAGINYAAEYTDDTGPKIISLSLASNGQTSTLMKNAVLNAEFFNVLVVASRGNYNASQSDPFLISEPAFRPEVISVGAMNPCGHRKDASSTCENISSWGSRYETSDNGGVQPPGALDIVAPGVEIYAAKKGGGYTSGFDGTSAAVPHVSGVVALLLSLDPTLTPAELRALLRNSAVDLETAGWDRETGYGKLDAYNALLALCEIKPTLSGCPTTPAPQVDISIQTVNAPATSFTQAKVNYDFSINNAGPDTASGVEFVFTHNNFNISSLTVSKDNIDITGNCITTGSATTCSIGDLANAGNAQIKVSFTFGSTEGTFSATAQTQSATTDTNGSNQLVQVTTLVNKAPLSTISQWNFDESAWSGANTVLDSVGTNHATAFGGASPTTSAEVASGSVAVLDGIDDYIKTPITFSSQGALSISAWYKTSNIGRNRMTVVGGNNGGSFEVYVDQGKPGCRVWKNNTDKSIFASGQFVGDWHQVICVQDFSAGQTRLYVDGLVRATTANVSASAGGYWHMGRPGSSLGTWFSGMIDNVTMYSQALDDADVQTLYTQQNIYSPATLVDTSILGEWKFDQSSWTTSAGQVIDSGLNGNHGTAQGGVQTGAIAGVPNTAANFDGINDAIATPLSFSNAYDVTISAWYKTDNAAQKRMTIIGGNFGGTFEMYVDKGKPACRVWDAAENSIFSPQSSVGVWTHVACVQHYGANPATELYVNGVLAASTLHSSVSSGGSWYIGRPGSSAATYFNGTIDHPMIRAKALDASEIATLYNGTLADYPIETFDSTLTSWYKFNEAAWSGQAGDVLDATGKNPAQSKNGVTQTVRLNSDKAATFDGVDDHIVTPIKFSSNASLSLSAWVKTGNQAKKRMAVIGESNGGRFELYVNQGKPGCRVWTTKDISMFSDTTIDGQFHHIMCVLDSAAGQTRLYVDGVLKKQVAGTSVSGGGLFFIGKSGSVSATYYEGLTDNVSLYSKAFSDAEALALFNQG